jgi:hypothetical protein
MGKIKIAEDKRNIEGEYFTKFYQLSIEATNVKGQLHLRLKCGSKRMRKMFPFIFFDNPFHYNLCQRAILSVI